MNNSPSITSLEEWNAFPAGFLTIHLYSPASSLLMPSNSRLELNFDLTMSMCGVFKGLPSFNHENSRFPDPDMTLQETAALPPILTVGKINGATTGGSNKEVIVMIAFLSVFLTQGMDDWYQKPSEYQE